MTRDTFKAKGTPPSAAQQQAQSDREVRAWETEDGRVISARQKETALRNGGASASSVANYNIPLYTTPPSVPVGVGTGLLRWVKAQADDPDANPRFRELYAALSQQPTVDGCHCGTCTCNPNMTPAVRFDLTPAQKEEAIHKHLIRLGWTPPVGTAEDMVLDAIERRESNAPAAMDEAAAIRAFEEHFNASADDPYFEGELELWLTAWRAALAQQPEARGGGEVCTNCKMPKDGRGWLRPVEMCQCATITSSPSAPVGTKTLSEFMAEQEALHPGIHDKVQAAADELRASLTQQPAAVDETQGTVDGWRLVVRYDEHDNEPCVWAEKDGSLVWIATLTGEHNEQD